jgi:transposase-like protein
VTDEERREELLDDKEQFTERLAETFEEREIVRIMLSMGLRYSDLALALTVHPRTVRAWIDEEDRDLSRQRDGILALKALVLFLLRRGILGPRQIAMWLVEPLESLEFRRPLAVLAEGRLNDVVDASRTFTRPEPALDGPRPSTPAVAAGAVPPRNGLPGR